MLGVLQTWTRDLRYHPHVHYLVPALALTPDAKRWLVGKSDFLLHVKPLGQLFRAKFRAALRQMAWAGQVDARTWVKSWVVDCRPVGSGASALKDLAPYIFQIALSNNRTEQVANDTITFRYTERKTGAQKRARLPLDSFIGRFLAHVLPHGFVKVRSTGCWRSGSGACWRRCGVSWHYNRLLRRYHARLRHPNHSWRHRKRMCGVVRHAGSRCSWFRHCSPSGNTSGWWR